MSKPYKSHPMYRAARRQVWRYRRQQLAVVLAALVAVVLVALAWCVHPAYWLAVLYWTGPAIAFSVIYYDYGDYIDKDDLEEARRTIDRLRWENLQKAGDGDE